MKSSLGCKLFGAHQALIGIRDGVVLLHSVVGCNFGSMSFHLTACDMTDVRQTCTVISDNDVVFGGEKSLLDALCHAQELYDPAVIFLLTGCVSDIVQDEVAAVIQRFRAKSELPVIALEAAGYRGNFADGFENALARLSDEMRETPPAALPTVNIMGLYSDNPRMRFDLNELERLLCGKVSIGTVFASCKMEDIRRAPEASLNIVFGGGLELARRMERRFGTPYVSLDYPYGLTGAKKLWSCLSQRFGLDFSAEEGAFAEETATGLRPIYSYLQALYGVPAAVIGESARARGMAEFLTRELGMIVETTAIRKDTRDVEDFYDAVRASEAAIIFGSSFEQELADEMEIPLIRFDFPVFDRVAVSPRPYIGAAGTLCIVEDILNEVINSRKHKGALYY